MRRSCTIINIIIYILLGRIPQQFWITTALVLLFAVANLTQHHGTIQTIKNIKIVS